MGERTVIKFRFFSKERGQALVEFALVLPLLLTIIMASMEFGWYYTSRYELIHYSRELGYNLMTPFTLSWKWGDWHTESGRRKPPGCRMRKRPSGVLTIMTDGMRFQIQGRVLLEASTFISAGIRLPTLKAG